MNTPQHIAIIPDGNRRWAKKLALVPWKGHEAGLKPFKKLIKVALEENIFCVSAWMASVNNLTKRPKQEIDHLYKVFEQMMDHLLNTPEINQHQVRIRAFGEWEKFQPSSLVEKIREAQEKTKSHDKHYLNLLNGYDGVAEMTRAVYKIAQQKLKNPKLKITPELIKNNLYLYDMPPVDLVIRTGGEAHWSSGFMMWDTANSYFHFTETLWPDLSVKEFKDAINIFRTRERRKGR